MTRQDFEKMYATARPNAIRLARGVCGSSAEDVVQDVAVYFFERLSTYPTVTPALFLKVVSLRARDRVKPTMGRNKYEEEVGGLDDLALLEKQQIPETGRRTPPAPRAE